MSTNAGRIALPAGARVVRRLTPPDVPWPSALVRTEDGASRLLVDAGMLAEWDGWDAEPDGHVLGPLDLLRRADGHDVLLPLCTERVETLLSRRGAGLPLTPGETVTLAVSVLRGMVELARRDTGGANGSWWLTDEGRPVFVDESDGPDAGTTTVDLLASLAGDAAAQLAGPLREAVAAVHEPRTLVHEIGDVERRLFEVASAEPLATAPLAAVRPRHASAQRETPAAETDGGSRSWQAALLASVDADLADAFSRATTAVWRRMRRPARRSHRRPWALAGCLGAGVIAIGLLWPAPGGPAAADQDAPTPSTWKPAIKSTVDSTAAPEVAAATHGDLVAVTDALLRARHDCLATQDDTCLAGVMEDPARMMPHGAVDAAADERTLTLLDEFGGVAVLRAEAMSGETSAQLVVVTERDGRWLLRDIHDAAGQP